MAGTPKKRASDMTGRQIDAANKKRDAEKAARDKEMSMATAAAKEVEETGLVDLSDPKNPKTFDADGNPVAKDEVEVDEAVVEVSEKMVEVRVNEDIDMTFAGQPYNMKVGPTYKIPAHIANWLEEKGIIWH